MLYLLPYKAFLIHIFGPLYKVLVQLHRGLEKGIIKFVGKTNFAAGNWVGIELDHCYGKIHVYIEITAFFKLGNE